MFINYFFAKLGKVMMHGGNKTTLTMFFKYKQKGTGFLCGTQHI